MANLVDRDGEVYLFADFIRPAEADRLFEQLREELAWRQESLVIAGRRVAVPRLVCWYGDPGMGYRYSGVDHEPQPWTTTLRTLKGRVEAQCGRRFNGVLGNFYRDGQDSMGWHADREPELGPAPFIASLSFGAARRFELRHNRSHEILSLPLSHGSLLVMGGPLQHHWRHRVPKDPAVRGARINLTFRTIVGTPPRIP
ncbi:alpha-ketoglutarate-dependent dioxygenase AlkB family protein [Candidatus Methylocalor cossyra]|uniref:Alkylated DNA repair dioxygenase AlkB n=1 Tax=Candidatus Methylocalor cossyra TaxID=3108543 RepID=A0ABP1C6D1_9GAMM